MTHPLRWLSLAALCAVFPALSAQGPFTVINGSPATWRIVAENLPGDVLALPFGGQAPLSPPLLQRNSMDVTLAPGEGVVFALSRLQEPPDPVFGHAVLGLVDSKETDLCILLVEPDPGRPGETRLRAHDALRADGRVPESRILQTDARSLRVLAPGAPPQGAWTPHGPAAPATAPQAMDTSSDTPASTPPAETKEPR